MQAQVKPETPIENLVFQTVDPCTAAVQDKFPVLIESLSNRTHWIIAPPSLLTTEESAILEIAPGCLAGMLQIYSALPLSDLSREIDEQHYREVSLMVSTLSEFSATHRLEFEIYLNSDFIGGIEAGIIDRGLQDGLLGEWKRALGIA